MTKKTIEIPRPILWSSKSRKWFNFCGHDTYAHEVCRIFGIHRRTFWHRAESGWPLAAALTAEPESGWCLNNAFILAQDPEVQRYCQTKMDEYFAEKAKYMRATIDFDPGKHLKLPTAIQLFAAELKEKAA